MVAPAARRDRAVRPGEAASRRPSRPDPQLRRLAGRAARVHQPQPLQLQADEGRDPAVASSPSSSAAWSTLSTAAAAATADRAAREFTATEESLLARLAESADRRARRGLARSHSGPAAAHAARETNVGFADAGAAPTSRSRSPASPSSPGRGQPPTIDIVYPVAALRSVEAAARRQDRTTRAARAASEWRERLGAAVGEVRDRGAHRAGPARAVARRADAARSRRRHPGQPAGAGAAAGRGPPDRARHGRRA